MKYCKKCERETARNASGACKPCACLATKAWKAKNIERSREANVKWATENKEKMDEYKAKYRQANKAKCVAASIKSREKRPDGYREYQLQYAASERGRESSIKRSHTRRARVSGAGGEYSREDIAFLMETQKGLCVCCRTSLSHGKHVDHVIPLVMGGRNDRYNLQLLCPKCNLQKSSKHPVDFMQSKGFLI